MSESVARWIGVGLGVVITAVTVKVVYDVRNAIIAEVKKDNKKD